MNIILLGVLYIIGILCLWFELSRHRTPRVLISIFLGVFILTVISRIDNYYSYSDLGAYIWRFKNGDDSYFGVGYKLLTSLIRQIFGNNETILLTIVASLNMLLALFSVQILSYEEINVEKKSEFKSSRYIGTFLLLYGMYWGLSFSAEVIRSGIAITLSLLVIALIIKKKTFLAILFYIISIAFHWTQIFLLPVLIIIKLENVFKPLKKSTYIIWIIFIFFADVINISSIIINIVVAPLGWILDKFSLSSHYSVYLTVNDSTSLFSYLSRQYLFYRITGILLIFGDLKNKRYNIFTYGYFIGLTIFTLLNALGAVTRMQWIFLVLSVYAFYYFVKDNKKYSKGVKGLIVTLYMLLQTIMAVLYLG